ncbi:MAG: amino acid permease [candidate division WOR-3 bacterium]
MELKKTLTLIDIFCLASGSMISSGIFILPGIAHSKVGPALFISYFLAGILAMTGAISLAELATAMPKAGGDYFFITRSLGPALGTISGVLSWFSITVKSSFALIGMSIFLSKFISFDIVYIALFFCIFFTILNIVGVKEASIFQIVLVIALLTSMIAFVVFGIPHIKKENMFPIAPYGVLSIFSTAGFVFVSYGGLLKVTSVSEEVKNPSRTIPLGLLISLFIVAILYSLMVIVATGILPNHILDRSLTPFNDAATFFGGKLWDLILTISALLAFISTANAGIMSASRYPFALSRDKMIPEVFSKLNQKFKTPIFSIVFTGIIMSIFLFLNVELLAKVASSTLILTYILANSTLIVIRESKLINYKPKFKSPLYPYLQIFGIMGFLFLLFEMGYFVLMLSFLLIVFSLFIYIFYGRIKVNREYALLYLLERITTKNYTNHLLQEELREILRERDEIEIDRFDKTVENSTIFDLKGKYTYEQILDFISHETSQKLNIDKNLIKNFIIQREEESSTTLSNFVAIPHLILEEPKKFEIFFFRIKDGAQFGSENDIKMIVLIACSRDERNFHLKSLSAIAQIVSDKKFEKEWLSAKNEKELKEILLLSERRRIKPLI